ncbi:Schizosaccharomyces pombe specific protein [Schizosaccharomyces pombe]|uniref:Meiotically up-regulated gene 52 protein n=1 Tax=Schizosaccharomyces pombe (strain 972 / ATCC 24843) TaxID=284812 RepID=MUG52_SCHPO|nr:uncharacterized protein SPAC17H9.18c [Schizosaccharomyces pombe]O13815.1 RecName: Full=Meiotically up-regulated gene 52 protein [Schizosaccharomyces pombe 972h-]CAB11227.1 dubious [Schizosaccharomyces pombe]|eukprot:NP_593587.1 uncharacterized protein SPAC17H9.18c [Schizosaccharomyces pombe]
MHKISLQFFFVDNYFFFWKQSKYQSIYAIQIRCFFLTVNRTPIPKQTFSLIVFYILIMIIQHLKEIHYLISASAKLLLASNYLLELLISHNIQFSPIRSFFIIMV